MGSFAALAMLGLFPNPGQDVYLITPPLFQEWSITNKLTGNIATVRNVNFDAGEANIFVQTATLNGLPYTKNWIGYDFFLNGSLLELCLGPEEGTWGTGEDDVPPSLSSSGKLQGYRT